MRQEARVLPGRNRERRGLDLVGCLSVEHANRRLRHRRRHVELDHWTVCRFEKQISINIWRVQRYSIIIVLEREKERGRHANQHQTQEEEQQQWRWSSSSHSSFLFIHNNVLAHSINVDDACVCVLTSSSSSASCWLISIFYFNMVQLCRVFLLLLLFASSTAVAIESVLNIMFNICQWKERGRGRGCMRDGWRKTEQVGRGMGEFSMKLFENESDVAPAVPPWDGHHSVYNC